MDEHKKFLADRILSEDQTVTYRLLSRALDVHVNTAKEMLFDFHKYQNDLRANSVYATYLVYGTKTSDIIENDGDVEMSSSMPDNDAFSESVPTKTMSLVKEEELHKALDAYQEVTSVHVYSLAPHAQKDLALLSGSSAKLSEFSQPVDDVTASRKYGIILNSNVRRKDRKGPPPAAIVAISKAVKQEPKVKQASTAQVNSEAMSSQAALASKTKDESLETSSKNSTPSSSAAKKPGPASKRGAAGGIMQSFAKAAAKPPKAKVVPKKEEEDAAMALSDDGEADDSDMPIPKKEAAEPESLRKTRKEREDELRRMMEDDDEDEEDEEENEEEPADEEMEKAPEPEPEPTPKTEEKEPAEVISASGDGRRRGKRKVMKKKRTVDDKGFMVTTQEAGWESFSEDEAPPAKKPTTTSTPTSSAPKAKKPATGKGNQGNIMSFFSKK